MRAFVVEGGTPGVKIVKLEHKMGIRVSDTAAISLVDARVPFDHLLGSAAVEKNTTGFKDAMATLTRAIQNPAAQAATAAQSGADAERKQIDGIHVDLATIARSLELSGPQMV